MVGFNKFVLLLIILTIAAGLIACGEPASETNYKLTHSSADAEYILSWDSIVAACPDIGACEKQEVFVRRGETKEINQGQYTHNFSLGIDCPAAWASNRLVEKSPTGEKRRDFGILIIYCETDGYLDELLLMETSGFPVEDDGDFVTGVLEQDTPLQDILLLLAGKHFVVLITESASPGETLFFTKEELMELAPDIKEKIASIEITPLPSDIPERVEEVPSEWREFRTFSSDELSPPVRVPVSQFFNNIWFQERPLVQVFNFTINSDWRFVMTASGEIDTRFEVYATITSLGEEGFSYSSDQVFSLHSETVTFTREQPLEERYGTPVDVEVKIFFDSPITWTFTIEK